MKKTLSLILALILTFSMGTLAFAEGTATAITRDEAKAIAIKHINYDRASNLSTAISGTYKDDLQGEVEVYNVTSTLVLKSGSIFIYETVVDKYSGKIYNQKATRSILDPTYLLNINLTLDAAYDVALDVVGVNKDNTVAFTKEPAKTADGRDAYHFVFVEGYSLKYECTVVKGNGSVEDIKVSQYNNESSESSGISGLLERIILVFKVLIAKLSISNLLEKISAGDLLKFFQSLSK